MTGWKAKPLKTGTLVCPDDLADRVLQYNYPWSAMTKPSTGQQDAKDCGGSVLLTRRIPNHHIGKTITTVTAFPKQAFRIWSLFTMTRNSNGTLPGTESLRRPSTALSTPFRLNATTDAEGPISRNRAFIKTGREAYGRFSRNRICMATSMDVSDVSLAL